MFVNSPEEEEEEPVWIWIVWWGGKSWTGEEG
jgi:hypothetical protein